MPDSRRLGAQLRSSQQRGRLWLVLPLAVAVAACADQELLAPPVSTEPSSAVVEARSYQDRAEAILAAASSPGHTGDLIVAVRGLDGRTRGMTPAQRQTAASRLRARFPDLEVKQGARRIVETTHREGDRTVTVPDTITNSFIVVRAPTRDRLAQLVGDLNVASVEPEAMNGVTFGGGFVAPAPLFEEIGWHMDTIRAPLEWHQPGTDAVGFATIDTGIQRADNPMLITTDIRWNTVVNLVVVQG